MALLYELENVVSSLKKLCGLSILLGSLLGCQDDDRDDSLINPEGLLGGTELAQFIDRDASTSDSGNRVVFLSTRTALAEDQFVTKAFSWQAGAEAVQIDASIPELADKQQLAVAINGSGSWTAMASSIPGEAGSTSVDLRLISAAGDKVVPIALAEAAYVYDIEFSRSASAFAIALVSSEGLRQVQYITFDETAGTEVSRSAAVAGTSFDLLTVDANEYLFVEQPSAEASTTAAKLYQVVGGNFVDLGERELGFADQISFSALTAAGPIVYQAASVDRRKPARGVDIAGLNRGNIKIDYEFKTLSFADAAAPAPSGSMFASSSFLEVEPVVVYDLSASQNFTLVLGIDRFVCSAESIFYIPTFTLMNHSSGSRVNFAVLLGDDDRDDRNRKPVGLTTDICGAALAENKQQSQFQLRITDVSLGSLDGSNFAMTYQSFDTIDPEIYLAKFKVGQFQSDELAVANFELVGEIQEVSNNYYRAN